MVADSVEDFTRCVWSCLARSLKMGLRDRVRDSHSKENLCVEKEGADNIAFIARGDYTVCGRT